jgi:glutathione S-transferase
MTANAYRLVIGNKNTSSWSLRPWLAMKQAGIAFEEVRINLREADMKDKILAHSRAGKVPVLWAGDLMIWDSLAIVEYVAEQHPGAALWPADPSARAIARSVSAEMHSGFQALREHCPMKLLSTDPKAEFIEPVQVNIRRVIEIWTEARARFGAGGPFLFGRFSVADAMYAPVASRLKTYVPDLTAFGDDGTAKAYVETIFSLPALGEWAEGARQEIAG